MLGVILSAGRGTRLKGLTAAMPKPMLPVAGRPCLEWIVEGLREAGVSELVVVTGYCAKVLETHFEDGARFRVRITYARQEVQNGTGAALLTARPMVGDVPFLMTYGDILISPMNYRMVLREHARRPSCPAVVGLNWVEDPFRGAAVYLGADGFVERIVEKPPAGTSETHWNNAGLYVFTPAVWGYLENLPLSPRGEYELPWALEQMLADGLPVRGLPLRGLWGDIGTAQDLAEMNGRVWSGEAVEAEAKMAVSRYGFGSQRRRHG